MGADGKYKQVHIDDSFYLKDGALDKIQVYLHSQQIDVLILDEDVFGNSRAMDISEVWMNCQKRILRISIIQNMYMLQDTEIPTRFL